jgi:ABC-2 type transport system ATP-binding protein
MLESAHERATTKSALRACHRDQARRKTPGENPSRVYWMQQHVRSDDGKLRSEALFGLPQGLSGGKRHGVTRRAVDCGSQTQFPYNCGAPNFTFPRLKQPDGIAGAPGAPGAVGALPGSRATVPRLRRIPVDARIHNRMSADSLIHVHELSKHFRTFKRREGVWGSIQNLFVRDYRTVAAVDRVGFTIERGEMVGYIGPNGAGKSTTIKMLTGILVPTSGEIRINGYVPYRQRRQYVKTIGVVFGQRTQLWWDIAVIESFKLLRRIYDVSQRDFDARMEHFDAILNIRDYLHTPVRKLSLGERMRCDLAAALLHNPPLLFLDEPTIGLDVVAKDHIRHFLRAINREFRTTVLLTTHDLDDIEELCRRIMIIDHGKVLYDGHLAQLKQQLLRTKQIKFVLKDRTQADCLDAFSRDGLEVDQVDELTYRIRFDRVKVSTSDLIRKILDAVEVRDLLIEDEPIEEIIKRIYAGDAHLEVSV